MAESGRSRTTRNRVYLRVSGVRIPPSPPLYSYKHLKMKYFLTLTLPPLTWSPSLPLHNPLKLLQDRIEDGVVDDGFRVLFPQCVAQGERVEEGSGRSQREDRLRDQLHPLLLQAAAPAYTSGNPGGYSVTGERDRGVARRDNRSPEHFTLGCSHAVLLSSCRT